MISSPSAFYLFFLHYQHFPTSPPDTLDTLDWVLTIHIRAGDHKWCMSYTAAQYFMSYVPKGSGISCRLWNRGFPSSIIMQSLGLTERSLSSISLTIWRRAFDLSAFARKLSATCKPMLYGTGVSGCSLSLRRFTFHVWVCDFARSWKATFLFACIRLSLLLMWLALPTCPQKPTKTDYL